MTKPLTACSSREASFALSDGEYTFKVQATNQAGNVQAIPTSYSWTAKEPVPDTTPRPLTSLASHPPQSERKPLGGVYIVIERAGINLRMQARWRRLHLLWDQPEPPTMDSCRTPYVFVEVQAKDPNGNVDPIAGRIQLHGGPLGASTKDRPQSPLTRRSRLNHRARPSHGTPTISSSRRRLPAQATRASWTPSRSSRAGRRSRQSPSPFGRHTLKIKASVGGIADPSPATVSFKVVRG